MMNGVVTARYDAIVRLAVQGPQGQKEEIDRCKRGMHDMLYPFYKATP